VTRSAELGEAADVSHEMRVVLSTYGSRGGVEPMAGLAVPLRILGAKVRVCAPSDCAKVLDRVGVPRVPIGVWR
jgi:vancomycin aglycone glucosyltransferase